jgi:hypothetical protein
MSRWKLPSVLLVTSCLLLGAPVTSAEAAPGASLHVAGNGRTASAATSTARPSTITAHLPTGTYRAGARAVVTGVVSGAAGRPVLVQVKGGNGTWMTLSRTTTAKDGTFTVAAPTWWVAHQRLRAYAPAAGADAAVATPTGAIDVTRTYTPRAGTAFSYLLGQAARWDPCRPITYRVNPSRLPGDGLAQVRAGFRAVSQATGLRFRYVGGTTFVPFKKGQKWTAHPADADFAIAWSTPTVVPDLSGSTLGVGGAQGVRADGPVELVHGQVALDATTRWAGTEASVRRERRALVLHEIGHAIGLGHVSDRRQIMFGTLSDSIPQYAAGDLRGLVAVGARGGCIADSQR